MKRKQIIPFLIVIVLGIIGGLFYFKNYYYEKPEATAVKALDALVAEDADTVNKYFDYADIYPEEDGEYYEVIMRDFTYTVVSAVQEDGTAVVTVEAVNRDIGQIYGDFVAQAYQMVVSNTYQTEDAQLGEEELKNQIKALLLTCLTDNEADTVTTQVDIPMLREGRSWKLEINDEIRDAFYGGYLKARTQAEGVLGDLSAEALKKVEDTYQTEIDDAQHTLRNAAHFIVNDIWNDVLCNIVSCINAGTDARGNEYDLAAGMTALTAAVKEKEEYDTYISSLSGADYSTARAAWKAYTDALDDFCAELKKEAPEAVDYDYEPDTTVLAEKMQAFVDIVYPKE